MEHPERLKIFEAWFAARGWAPWPYQRDTWRAYLDGASGLVHVPTGAGKTLAAMGGPLLSLWDAAGPGLKVIYVSPIRALVRDIELSLLHVVRELGLPLTVEARTGDTTSHRRKMQLDKPPHLLVTTPESLSLMQTYERSTTFFAGVEAVILDEWHELDGTKRGVLLELALARLATQAPRLKIWALSATMADPTRAAHAATSALRVEPVVIEGAGDRGPERRIHLDVIEPDGVDSFPWAGHLGITMVPKVLEAIDPERPTLLFTNTRFQAERWYRALLDAAPERTARTALHHGSIDCGERESVEHALKNGALTLVVATSSLDLGVDFGPVEAVVQIGSIKSLARLVQRAGRASHRPGQSCRLTFVPTHALELLEIAAARQALAAGRFEARRPIEAPTDVLLQHIVSAALAGGFVPDALFDEVRRTATYKDLPRHLFDEAIFFLRSGGRSLSAYPMYRKLEEKDGRLVVTDKRQALVHRMNVGTIVSGASVGVRFFRGQRLGHIDESFAGKLRPGDVFAFGGRTVAFVKMWEGDAIVKNSSARPRLTSQWAGSALPLSTTMGEALRRVIASVPPAEGATGAGARAWARAHGIPSAAPLVAAQAAFSAWPRDDELLVESLVTREGRHVFVFPFEGRIVNEAIGLLAAYRLTQQNRVTISVTANDYGFELLGPHDETFARFVPEILTTAALEADAEKAVDVAELARRRFREIGRISGLTPQTHPGRRKTGRQVLASAGLLYDVFRSHEPDHLLLAQAHAEALTEHFDFARLEEALLRLRNATWIERTLTRPSPLGFPLLVERQAARFSSESLAERVERMKRQWTRVGST